MWVISILYHRGKDKILLVDVHYKKLRLVRNEWKNKLKYIYLFIQN